MPVHEAHHPGKCNAYVEQRDMERELEGNLVVLTDGPRRVRSPWIVQQRLRHERTRVATSCAPLSGGVRRGPRQ